MIPIVESEKLNLVICDNGNFYLVTYGNDFLGREASNFMKISGESGLETFILICI